jgi:VIT1/CCC1 family predicted Fe2+/Mn2+ transporter
MKQRKTPWFVQSGVSLRGERMAEQEQAMREAAEQRWREEYKRAEALAASLQEAEQENERLRYAMEYALSYDFTNAAGFYDVESVLKAALVPPNTEETLWVPIKAGPRGDDAV